MQELDETSEEMVSKLQGVCNFLRGMTLDPALPPHVKQAVEFKLTETEDFLERIFSS